MRIRLTAQFWAWIVVIFALIIGVGVVNLDADGWWYDEWWSLYNAGATLFGDALSPAQILTRVATEDPAQMPGYPLVLAAWGNAVGWTELAGRALSLLAGLLAAAVTCRFALAITRHDALTALCATAVMAGSAWFLYFTHELRAFSLVTLCAVTLLYGYWRIAQRPHLGWGAYIIVAGAGSALIYLHPFALALYATVGVWHIARLFTRGGRAGWIRASAALAFPALALIPWLPVLLGGTAAIRDVERARLDAAGLFALVAVGGYVFSSTVTPLFGLFAAFSLRARGARLAWALALVLIGLLLGAYGFARVSEIRYSIAIVPLLALIGGMGVAALHRRGIPAPLLLALWIAPALIVDGDPRFGQVMQNTYPQPNREMARILRPYLSERAAVIVYVGTGLRPEQQQTVLVQYLERVDMALIDMESAGSIPAFANRVHAAVEGRDYAWMLYSPLFEGREYALTDYLLRERDFFRCRTLVSDPRMEITAYGRLNRDAPAFRYALVGDTALSIHGIGTPERVGDRALVWLGFSGDAPAGQYSFGLHLTDANGNLIAQHDEGLPAPGDACRLFDLPISGLPQGAYMLRLIVYDWRTGTRWNGTAPDGTTGDSLPLAVFTLP